MQYIGMDKVERMRTAIDPDAYVRKTDVVYENGHFWRRARELVRRDRFGEVVFAVERPNGRVVTVTSREYPEGIHRVPTGGIAYGEDILSAVHREVREELGLDVTVVRFLGVIAFRIRHEADSFPFYSFLFHLREAGGRLLEDATDDEVSGVREVDAEQLEELSGQLLSIRPDWRDWGRFRHETTHAFVSYFKQLPSPSDAERTCPVMDDARPADGSHKMDA